MNVVSPQVPLKATRRMTLLVQNKFLAMGWTDWSAVGARRNVK